MRLRTIALAIFLSSCAAEQKPMAPAEQQPASVESEASSVPVVDGPKLEEERQEAAKPKPVVAGVESLVKSHTEFAFDLHKVMPSQNVVYSPYSIATVLGAVAVGADAETASQLNSVLRLSPESANPALNRTLADILATRERRGERGFRLKVANGMWVQQNFALATDFLRVTENEFLFTPKTIDFAQSDAARASINTAVADATEQRIKDLIKPNVLGSLTRLVITNAVYFSAPWRVPFQVAATQDDTFSLLDGKAVSAPFMNQTGTFPYLRTDELEAIALPYAGDDVVAWIVLPNAKKFADVDAALSSRRFAAITESARPERVSVSLPKFEVRSSLDLKSTLKTMGVVDAFDPNNANFTKMVQGKEPLYVSAFAHDGFIRVDEAGTEAAAATAAVMTTRSLSPPSASFVANRPFLMLIVDKTGEILFVTRVVNPLK
ncbi:MAG: serpin family protein [bacterium]